MTHGMQKRKSRTLTVGEIAEKHGVAISTVYSWFTKGLEYEVIEARVAAPAPSPRIIRTRVVSEDVLARWFSANLEAKR